MTQHTRFGFDGNRLEPVTWCQSTDSSVIAADSFRVVEGGVVGFVEHRDRFSAAVRARAPELSDVVDRFVEQAVSLIPRQGEFFPRWECVSTSYGPTLQLLLREAPPRLPDAILATADHDPRTSPDTKGPDLERLMALRRSVNPRGANEAVIVSPEGYVVEGAYSSVIVWPEPDKDFWVVGDSLPRIRSVSEKMIVDLATHREVTASRRLFRPAELEGCVVWVVSALHGIRRVRSWVDGPDVIDDAEFRNRWQQMLISHSEGLPRDPSD